MDTAIAAPNSDITEELLTAQALALYADIEQLLCIGEEIKTTGSIECLYGFHFDMKALHVDLDDHFKVGPNWGHYTGSWEDLKACAESLKAMVDRYKIFATKEELFTNDLTKIINNFATIKTRLEPLPTLAKLSHMLAQFNPHASCTERELKDAFSAFGPVIDAVVLRNHGQSIGSDKARAAIAQGAEAGIFIKGQRVRVAPKLSKHNPKRRRNSSPDRRHGA
ncbi:uncharacterized protein ACA1_396090 [Acanthamoeba castellanii str. Neff]|uniref:RRM domain-containing protein n=1 Tax=Acanthamoeba castellanii (strain ATCC 30010 / Neff) TaxID=1257118 RepID=L8HBB9_ACACF|nr:uncharacterized protein ACA1_396090 [Acanthamoeba castellanii str. Neff]ELR22824.1 hypothetical protein ACA1_396090 [Acanthamoeba castellanii str. Neff]